MGKRLRIFRPLAAPDSLQGRLPAADLRIGELGTELRDVGLDCSGKDAYTVLEEEFTRLTNPKSATHPLFRDNEPGC
jgi:hypothetical protein